jgi:hypothetical protein
MTAPVAISERDLLRFRLASQRIDRTSQRIAPAVVEGQGVTDTVRHLFAMQAQDFAQALWGVGLRTPRSTRRDVRAAMERGEIVRSSPLRGTLMFLAAEDLRWMLRLTSERNLSGLDTRHRQLEIDEATLSQARDQTERVLAGGGLGRDAYLRALEDAGIRTTGQRGYHIIWMLAQRGVVCWGPPNGTQQALVLVDDWIASTPELDRDEALGQFAVRYLRGHGAASLADLAWWSGLTKADARRGIAVAAGRLNEVSFDGTAHWIEAGQQLASTRSAVHALPGFDEYLLGYADRSAALPAEFAERIVPGKNGIFLPTIVRGGRVAGTWRRTTGREGTTLTRVPFAPLTDRESAALDRESERIHRFFAD